MLQLMNFLWREEKGQTFAEYGLILALVALIVIAFLGPLGDAVGAVYNAVTTQLAV